MKLDMAALTNRAALAQLSAKAKAEKAAKAKAAARTAAAKPAAKPAKAKPTAAKPAKASFGFPAPAPRRHETTVSVVPPAKAKRTSTKQKTAKKPSQRRTAKGS